ncbi:MAG: hypothetical protein E7039_10385 [Lentisphaerae bacterium]|nr:hypothetical protein [Lentisphaerota bacterium]
MSLKNILFTVLTFFAVSGVAAPRIDGKLDNKEWQGAVKFDHFNLIGTNNNTKLATALLLHDRKGVYIGFKLLLKDGRTPVAKAVTRDGRVSVDESVEMMIVPTRNRDTYIHLAVNSRGTIYDAFADQGGFLNNPKWNGNFKVKTFVGKDFWSAEIFVPYSTMDLSQDVSDTWAFNFCHNAYKKQYSSILPKGAYHVAGAFVPVKGFDYDFSDYGIRVSSPVLQIKRQGNEFICTPEIKLVNTADKSRKVKLDLTLTGNGIAAVDMDAELAGKSGKTFRLPPVTLKKAGDYRAIVSIMDTAKRKTFVKRSFPATVKFNPIKIELIDPHYRNAIFASMQLEKIRYNVTASEDSVFPLTTGIMDEDGKVAVSKKIDKPGIVEFPVAALDYGRYKIFAGNAGDKITVPLLKLAPQENEVWRDKQGFWRANGKRFFMISEWANVHVPGVNLSNSKSQKQSRLLDMNTMNFGKFFRKSSIDEKDEKAIRKVVKANKKNPRLFARYLSDEPEVSGANVNSLVRVAEIIRDEDPYHPLVISNDSIGGMRDYVEACEINGLHPYPIPKVHSQRDGFGRVAAFMDQAAEMNSMRNDKQSIFYLQQGFNYGDFASMNSRIPTFDEVRTQFLMTVIMGGRGIMFYNRTTEHYPELYIGMPEVGREFAALHDVLCEDDQPGALTQGKLRTMIKKHNGKLWIFAVSTQIKPFEFEFNFPELGNQKLTVWREGRKITAENGRFSDKFNNFDVHIYTTDLAADNMRTVAEVEKAIAQANAKRRKVGNKAFQMFEHEHLKMSCSSNFWPHSRPADNTLWHVTDGIVIGDRATTYDNQRTYFKDKTPGKLPDWIAMEFKKPVKATRVKVCSVKKALKNYEVQSLKDGKFITIAKVENVEGDWSEVSFPETEFKVLRILVTAIRGKYTQIAEIEVYRDQTAGEIFL